MTPDERDRLAPLLDAAGLPPGPVTVRRIGEGHSNRTYLVERGGGRAVLRRPPPPPVPAGGHDVLREAALLRALDGADLPVPRVLASAAAGEVLDDPLYVMTHVDGPVVTTRTPPPLDTPARRAEAGVSLVTALARLHAVDVRSGPLAALGRPDGFNRRHVERIARLVTGPDGAPPDAFAALEAWLLDHVPPEAGAAVVHHDYRLGNVVLAPDAPGRVAAVLDWELATLGDPLWDLAYLVASWPDASGPATPTQALSTAQLEPGWPRRDEVAGIYTAAAGHPVGDLSWYLAAVQWKLAVLYEYQRRKVGGPGGDPYYADPGHVEAFLAAALAATR